MSSAVSSPASTTLTLGGARLLVPAGWVGRRTTWSEMPQWCLEPASKPLPYFPDDCPMLFSQIPAGGSSVPISADIEGGLLSNPQFCRPDQIRSYQLLDYGDVRMGGRAADYRRWQMVCKNGRVSPIEQYVVATRPGYIVFSQNADSGLHSVISQLAAGSILPAATGTLRYCDFGIVRTISHQSDGYHLRLDRVVKAPHGIINNNPTSYPYLVPDGAVQNGRPPVLGGMATLATDGFRVTQSWAS